MAYLTQEGIRKQIETRKKKEANAVKAVLPILFRLLDENHIVIPVKSERTSDMQYNRVWNVIEQMRTTFFIGRKTLQDALANNESEPFENYDERCMKSYGYDAKTIFNLFNTLQLWNVNYSHCSIKWANLCDNYTAHAELLFAKGKYTIKWVPDVQMKTAKRNASDLCRDAINRLMDKMGVIENTCLPKELKYGPKHPTQEDIEDKIRIAEQYINDPTFVPKPCSSKQAPYCAKFLDVPVEVAANLNMWQAREILDYYFDELNYEQEHRGNLLKTHYLEVLKPFM